MSTTGKSKSKIAATAATLLFATSMTAQRYQGHDHHVYHPPVQTKQQSVQAAGSHAHVTATTAANAPAHGVNPTSQNVPANGAASTSKVPVTPSSTSGRQPQ